MLRGALRIQGHSPGIFQYMLRSLQAEQQQLTESQQRLYDERTKLKKEMRLIDTMKANVDDFLSPSVTKEQEKSRSGELE